MEKREREERRERRERERSEEGARRVGALRTLEGS